MINTTDILLSELYSTLDSETDKPADQWNEKVIISVSKSIVAAKGYKLTEVDIEKGKKRILARIGACLGEKEIRKVDRERIG